MSWNYDVESLDTNSKDQVRFLIGDTNTNDQQLQDEEIEFTISIRSSIWGAAASCCAALAASMSRLADTTTGELRTLYSSRARAYNARAGYYEQKSSELGGGLPLVGGISIADKLAAEIDPDRVPPQFNIGMTDNFNQPVAPAGNESGVPAPNTSSRTL